VIDDSGRWRKSSYSGGQNNNCVELDMSVQATRVRDSKCRQGGFLKLDRTAWESFVATIKPGAQGR
jgi:Domain of unknown function (DUF397)